MQAMELGICVCAGSSKLRIVWSFLVVACFLLKLIGAHCSQVIKLCTVASESPAPQLRLKSGTECWSALVGASAPLSASCPQ